MQNFWEKSNWLDGDKHILLLRSTPFYRPFPSLPDGPGLFCIRGPRQVGKSSWLKTLLSQSDPHKSFYLSCENVRDFQDLQEILKSISDRSIIYFDEITFVEEWWRAIKHKLDQDDKVRIVITGSHAFDIRKGMDQMPGRWGNGGEFELLPMTFEEFCQMREQAKWPILKRTEELELYFRIGGFPLSLKEAGPQGLIPLRAQETYKKWLVGDILKIGRSEEYLKQVLAQLAITMGSTISLQTLAKKTQIGSHNTAQEYIEILEACFGLKTLYALDPNRGNPRFRKEKKYYFRDPLIYWMALDWAGFDTPENFNDQISEMVANEHLSRKYKNFGYYSDAKGEIDFYQANKWALEVKWKNYAGNISEAYKRLLIPQKIIWTKNNFLQEWPT
jgi:predicted AAA+ superfamily ATPase